MDYFFTKPLCVNCGENSLVGLTTGGCGGLGSHYACEACDIVYEQCSGGYLPTSGGEQYQRTEWKSVAAFMQRLKELDAGREERKRLQQLSDENKKIAIRKFKECLAEIHSLGFEVWVNNEYAHHYPIDYKTIHLKERKK